MLNMPRVNKSFMKLMTGTALLLAALTICAVSYFRVLDNYELALLDLRFVFRWPKIPTSDKIVFIEIGQDSIDALGRFPFDRNYHAILIKALSESKSRMILFDFLFSEGHVHDKELEYALDQARNVYLPYAFDVRNTKSLKVVTVQGYIAKCLEELAREARGTGHINIIPDPDGKFRRIPVFVKYEDTFYPYISFVMGCDYLGLPLKDIKFIPGRYIAYGKGKKIPLDDSSNMIVNFSGEWGSSYKHYSYVDVLRSYFAKESGEEPILNLNDFEDKICIVGLTASGTGDSHPNPFQPIYPGMGIHAEVINSMINERFIARASRALNIAILLLLSFLISVVTLKTKPMKGLFTLLAGIFSFIVLAISMFSYFGIWIDMLFPVIVMMLFYLSLTLYKYVLEWKGRLLFENELGIAKKIQESLLPKRLPGIKGLEIATAMSTARQVGGDLYDFVELGEDKLGVMIGDVSGKGIPASLFMAMVTGSFKFFSKAQPRPGEVLLGLNQKIVGEHSSNLFVTMFYAIFDMKNKCVDFSNGGHLPVMRMDRAGSVHFLDSGEGMPLGLMEGGYSQDRVELEEGDVFVFYTDGITEAMNSKSELYGNERLNETVKSSKNFAAGEILKAIYKDVRKFEPKSRQHDDMTVIIVKI